MSKTIRAFVSQRLLEYVEFLFDQSADGVLTEVLQNARRAGAKRVEVTTGGSKLTITDDGCGVEDMQHLLGLSDTGWDENVQSNELPAGMGFYALAPLGKVTVTSRGRRVTLDMEAFKGKRDVEVEEANDGPETGTRIEVIIDNPAKAITIFSSCRQVLARFQLTCTLNGEHIAYSPLVPAHAEVILDADGNHLFRAEAVQHGDARINLDVLGRWLHTFISRSANLPFVARKFNYRVALIRGRELDLVPPARLQVVENEKLSFLQEKLAELAIETVVAHDGLRHRLSFADRAWGLSRGMKVPEPLFFARMETPHSASGEIDVARIHPSQEKHWRAIEQRSRDIPDDPHYVSMLDDTVVTLMHLSKDASIPLVLENNSSCEGYSWFPKERLTATAIFAKLTADSEPVDVLNAVHEGLISPEKVFAECWLELARLDGELRAVEGAERIRVNLPIVPLCDPDNWDGDHEKATGHWARVAGVPDGFYSVDLLEYLFLNPSDDSDAPSEEEQRESFRSDVSDFLSNLFGGPLAALENAVRRQLTDYNIRTGARQVGKPVSCSFTLSSTGEVQGLTLTPQEESA